MKTEHATILTITSVITAALAILALVLSYQAFNDRLNSVQASRTAAALDTCYLLRGLVFSATQEAHAARAGANAYIHATQLRNCRMYAYNVIHHP